MAVRHDALEYNPVRDVAKIKRSSRSTVQALTVDETKDLIKHVDAEAGADETSRRADELDRGELCQFMLGTGVRVGEALAVRRNVVDWTPA